MASNTGTIFLFSPVPGVPAAQKKDRIKFPLIYPSFKRFNPRHSKQTHSIHEKILIRPRRRHTGFPFPRRRLPERQPQI
jgi:hypothetical protein